MYNIATALAAKCKLFRKMSGLLTVACAAKKTALLVQSHVGDWTGARCVQTAQGLQFGLRRVAILSATGGLTIVNIP